MKVAVLQAGTDLLRESVEGTAIERQERLPLDRRQLDPVLHQAIHRGHGIEEEGTP